MICITSLALPSSKMKCFEKSYKRINVVHFILFRLSKTLTPGHLSLPPRHVVQNCLLSREKPMILSEVGGHVEVVHLTFLPHIILRLSIKVKGHGKIYVMTSLKSKFIT